MRSYFHKYPVGTLTSLSISMTHNPIFSVENYLTPVEYQPPSNVIDMQFNWMVPDSFLKDVQNKKVDVFYLLTAKQIEELLTIGIHKAITEE